MNKLLIVQLFQFAYPVPKKHCLELNFNSACAIDFIPPILRNGREEFQRERCTLFSIAIVAVTRQQESNYPRWSP